MSDYMFMLESHLSTEQFQVVGEMQKLAAAAGSNLFLTGGALRDMIGGFPVRDLDFTIETNPLRLAKAFEKTGAEVTATDDLRKCLELEFPAGVTVSLGMAHSEKFAKSGGKPQITPATIHDDLRARDFTVNAIALSLNRASLGLPIDPTNGVGDIERKELRAIHNYIFYDDPARLLRLIRFKVRLGYAIDERTRLQYENAREAEMLTKITPEALGAELRHIAAEPLIGDLIRVLEEEKLITLYSPALEGDKLNLATFHKLQKARQVAPIDYRLHAMPLFLAILMEELNAKERSALIKAAELTRQEIGGWQKLEVAAKKFDKDLRSPKLQKPSALYQVLSKAPGEVVLYLLVYSEQRLVQDRIRNYFQKYLPTSLEITDEMVAATLGSTLGTTGAQPGTPKFAKAKEDMIHTRLDSRPKKVVPEPEPAPPPPMSSFARGPGPRVQR
jgi:tRNA nucleotidyltransferase (CCA-adding enzyme)